METCLKEERAQAAEDRRELLTQITDLVNQSGESQNARWESKINAIREDISNSKSTLQDADNDYNSKMDVWSQKENLLVEEVLKSRDCLKGKMKEDWKGINEHNTLIQATTRSVHEETIRIVDAQMKDMARQMQTLDDFVTRARSQNERHHESHIKSLQGLASTVNESYSSIGDHFITTHDRVRNAGDDVSAQSKNLQETLPTLSSTIQQPLMNLRDNITETALSEYRSTGETPQKKQYHYPTTLPQTQPHEKLLGKPPQPIALASPTKSPSKGVVYTDAPATDSSLVQSASPSKESNLTSLREVSRNVNASLPRNNSDSVTLNTLKTGKPDPETVGMGPPPLKRLATMESKLPQKFGGGKSASFVKLEGRENFGAGRRLRSSPTQ